VFAWIWSILVVVYYLAVIAAVYVILRRPREPRAMLGWLLALLLLPPLGLIVFLIFGEPRKGWHRLRRRRSRKRLRIALRERAHSMAKILPHAPEVAQPHLDALMHLARRLGAFPPTPGNDVTIYHDAEMTFLALQLAIESAQSHVHLEYFIFQSDDTGRVVRDLLIAKSREGVACRVLLDSVGSWRLSWRFLGSLRDAGVQVAFSMPMIPWRGRWRVNYRNHRKIAVIDGLVGFTGSQNIGDEYSGRLAKHGPWRDTHMKIVGPGVQPLQETFTHDWYYTTREDLLTEIHFPPQQYVGEHVVQTVPSGPDQRIHVMHQLLFAAVSAAQSSVCIITPYFVPDSAMVLALQSACYRGVHVELIVPGCSNHRVALWAGRSFYPELIQAGVRIYEHDDAMLHSKVMIVDESWAMVGSANMDERSFRLNFELTTLLYSESLAQDLYQDFESIRTRSRQITMTDLSNRSQAKSILLGLARLASPML